MLDSKPSGDAKCLGNAHLSAVIQAQNHPLDSPKTRKNRPMTNGQIAADMIGTATLAFANTLLHSLCNHFADAIANDCTIEHWIESVGWKRLLRLQNRMSARTILVRFLG